MRATLRKLLPTSVRERLRYSKYSLNRSALRMARGSKRLDICAAQFAHVMHLAHLNSLEGKTCLEIGSGRVLTHAIVSYLLGAARVIATDISPIARPSTLKYAISESVKYIPRDMLAPFSTYTAVRERYQRLLDLKNYDFAALERLGIEYRSPVDFAREEVGESVDFIYSNSALEHVPIEDISPLLINLSKSLSSEGLMLHRIHLEDHHFADSDPFRFLSIPSSTYSQNAQSARGNRVRFSAWRNLFNKLPNMNTDIV